MKKFMDGPRTSSPLAAHSAFCNPRSPELHAMKTCFRRLGEATYSRDDRVRKRQENTWVMSDV
jgi:hypothetical protein